MKIRRLFFFACLGIQVCLYPSEGLRYTFRCRNNDYIRDGFFCDTVNNCPGGEDEGLGCKYEGNNSCGTWKFACDGSQCHDLSVRCNTIKDCEDGTDELNCGDEIDVKNCKSEDKFLCEDGLRCLGLEYTCDGYCHCFDCSDENSNCSIEDNDLLKKCPHAYFVTAKGPQCLCESSNTSSSALCDSISYCHPKQFNHAYKKYFCQQRCVQFKNKRQCSCYEGYEPINGTFGSQCSPKDHSIILYTNGLEIKSQNNISLETSTILRGIANCTLLTAANDHVYYATVSHDGRGSLFKTALKSEIPEKLIETKFTITSTAIDYITNNVYFTGNGSVSVCSNNGQICTQIKCCNAANSVALAPKSGWMFYMLKQAHSDEIFCRNGYFLTKSNMDGSNEHIRTSHCYSGDIIIDMDESESSLYLLERHDKEQTTIYRIFVDYLFENAHEPSTLSHFPKNIQHFSIYKGEIFFTQNMRDGILYLPNIDFELIFFKTGSEPIAYLNDSSTSGLANLYVYNAAIQYNNENPCNKSSCSGLCLIKPEMKPSKHFLNHTCFCDHFSPTEDGHWCSIAPEQVASHTNLWIGCILVLSIFSGTGYYMLKKRQWRRRQKIESDQNVVSYESYSTRL